MGELILFCFLMVIYCSIIAAFAINVDIRSTAIRLDRFLWKIILSGYCLFALWGGISGKLNYLYLLELAGISLIYPLAYFFLKPNEKTYVRRFYRLSVLFILLASVFVWLLISGTGKDVEHYARGFILIGLTLGGFRIIYSHIRFKLKGNQLLNACKKHVFTQCNVNEESESRNTVLKQRFNDRVVAKKMFLQPNLRMDEVAVLLHSNRTYISEMINSEFEMNYSSYINHLRINYAKELMLRSQDLKQEELASRCGFPNAASFNRAFKQDTGYPPKAWLNNNAEQK
ncbi:MAG: helix-turn-helix domain-containing protein [Bacteroidales bacterium]